ncbi:FtsX-like permease family protein [Carboxydochorda subterranea]|uniref:FtsX-like permease family protein n=1 Tax=Carboxydichorda subterranea TaxID=3109565 RepID=A0ABZ1BX03_9FIRM|nr:FtsX-like permease family protein [Limnochorda sp. L945t]WRP17228.1 FtsX-like permease family protein [Limnochorda sp. L945t]
MWRIAARNVARNRRRSALSGLVIAAGVAALMIANGYNRFTFWGLNEVATSQYGHLQIARPAYWENRGELRDRLLDGPTLARLIEVVRQYPGVESAHPLLSVSGLVGNAANSTVFVAEGSPPGAEFASAGSAVREGRRLLAGDKERVLLGTQLARALGVELGDWVTVFTSTVDGAYNAGNAQVVGLIQTGMAEADSRLAVVPLEDARRLMGTDGADRLAVLLSGDRGKQDAEVERAAAGLQAALRAAGLDVEVRTRAQLATFMRQVRGMYDAIFGFLSVVIFGVVLVSVLESLTLSFFERIREMGTVLALGTGRGALFFQILAEGAILGALGAAAGVALGWGIGEMINHAHLTYVPPTMNEPVPLAVRMGWGTAAAPAVVGLVAALLSGIYPAWAATRIQVVEALRHV